MYKGYDRAAGRLVLLKTIRPELGEDAGLMERFEEEGRLVAPVRHPNVVAVYESGRDGATAYLVTEFVEGLDLRALVERGALPAELAAFVLLEAARGLAAVHAAGILHRDLKPANVLVSEAGAVKLADFGLASLAPDREAERAESGGEVRGTLAYLAPEVVRGAAPSAAADLFALGAILFEMLAGRAAFARETPGETLDAVVNHDPIPVLEADPRVPPTLTVLAAKLLAKEPARRIGEADALVARLEQFLAGYEGVGPDALAAFVRDPVAYRPARTAPAPRAEARAAEPAAPAVRSDRKRRPWVPIGLGALALAAIGLGAVQLLTPAGPPAEDAVGEEAPAGVQPLETAPAPVADSVGVPEGPVSEPIAEVPGPAATPGGEAEGTGRVQDEEHAEATRPDERARAPAAQDAQPEAGPEPTEAEPEPAEAGTLTVAAVPWARVFVNGAAVGETPVEALALPPGRHAVRLENPEFPPHEAVVEVGPGEAERLAVSLWSLVGRVKLEVHPWARVSVDGAYWDTVPPQERPLVLAPGTHRLTLTHDALGTYEATVSIAAGETRTLRFNLPALLQ